MKIALCFSGQPRNFVFGYNTINRNLLKLNDVDVFGHLWWSKEEVNNEYRMTPHSGFNIKYYAEADLPDKINKLYNFKKYNVEASKFFTMSKPYNISFNQTSPALRYNATISKFYSLEKSLNLVKIYEQENDISYDWILLTRTDINLVHNIIDLDKLEKGIYVGDCLHPRNQLFDDNVWLLHKDFKYIFSDILQKFDEHYESMLKIDDNWRKEFLTTLNDEWKQRASSIIYSKDTHAEIVLGFHLIFKNLLPNVKEIEMLKHSVIR